MHVDPLRWYHRKKCLQFRPSTPKSKGRFRGHPFSFNVQQLRKRTIVIQMCTLRTNASLQKWMCRSCVGRSLKGVNWLQRSCCSLLDICESRLMNSYVLLLPEHPSTCQHRMVAQHVCRHVWGLLILWATPPHQINLYMSMPRTSYRGPVTLWGFSGFLGLLRFCRATRALRPPPHFWSPNPGTILTHPDFVATPAALTAF